MQILLVDDDELIVETTSQVLEKDGHEVTKASDGVQATAFLNDNQYDLMICDIIMPNKEGLETISDAIKSGNGMKIIAMSAGGAVSNTYFLEAAKLLGTDATLKKPFTPEELLEKVHEV